MNNHDQSVPSEGSASIGIAKSNFRKDVMNFVLPIVTNSSVFNYSD